MSEAANLPLLIGALAAGAAAAQLKGPLASDWRARKGVLRRRLLDIATPVRLPGPGRRLAGAAILAFTLTTGALAAYAAEPSAPERLATQAAGVVGSGDQLALRVKDDSQERTIKPGDDYADGWKLDRLTPTSATLVKDGESREVGLNPTGALASNAPPAPASQVSVTLSDAELIDRVIRNGQWDGKTPRPNLTLDETRRYYILRTKGFMAMGPYIEDVTEEAKSAGYPGVHIILDSKAIEEFAIALLGAEKSGYIALLNKQNSSTPLSVDDVKAPDEIILIRRVDLPPGQDIGPIFWRQAAP